MSRPAIFTEPSVAASSRISILIRVDLPQPVGPTRKTNSPRRIEKVAFSRPTDRPA